MVRKPFTTGDTEVHEGMPQRVLVSGLWDLAAGAECCQSNELWSFAPLDSRGRVPLRVRLSGQTRGVIGQAQEQQEQEPRHRGNQDGFGHLLACIFHVHEDESYDGGLERGDRERNNRIEFSEIDSCDPRGKDGTDNQDRPDQPV